MEELLDGLQKNIRINTPLNRLRSNMSQALASSGSAHPSSNSRLANDIAELADLYCSILGSDEVQVRLEIVTTNSCRKWHSDYVKARLITTYVGDGTQWLDTDEITRLEQRGEPRRVNQLRTGDVGIFKGKFATGQPAIHRSPPIAGTGQKRLLLVLDPSAEK